MIKLIILKVNQEVNNLNVDVEEQFESVNVNTYGNPNMGPSVRYGYGGMFYDGYETPQNQPPDTEDPKENKQNQQLEQNLYNREYSSAGFKNAWQTPGSQSQKRKAQTTNRRIEGELDEELQYSDYNQLPIAAGYRSRDYEYGYSFIPPEKWYPQPPRPPICVTEKRCPVMASYANGTPTDVKEFNASRRITQPYQMNVDYVQDKFNSGR